MNIISIVMSIFTVYVDVLISYKLATAFNKGMGFTIGLILLPNIFTLILGLGSAEYVGNNE